MNWSDIAVIAIIGVFALIGMKKGFVMSLFKLLSFFICIYASIKFYPVLSDAIKNTPVYATIKDYIIKNLMTWSQEKIAGSTVAVSGAAGADAILGSLPLPGFFKESMLEKMPAPSELINMKAIIDSVGEELTGIVLAVISLIVLYIVLSILFSFAGIILKGISKLPVFKQIDKLGGILLGAVQGFLAVYVICAVLVLFNANTHLASVFNALDNSLYAGWFYENNFIINFIS